VSDADKLKGAMRRILLYSIPVLVVLTVWWQSALYSVDQAEFVYVTRFGEPVAIYDGESAAGLHCKWPFPMDSVRRIDRRLQVFDLPAIEPLTRDQKNRTVDKTLTVDAFVCWKVPDTASADRFVRAVGSPEQARRLLTPLISGRLSAVVSNMPIDDLISLADRERIDARMEHINRQILGYEAIGPNDTTQVPLPELTLRDYGIQLVEVRLRRFNYPEAVRGSIYNRIRSERDRRVTVIQSEGNRQYTKIVSDASTEATKIVDDARASKQIIEARADADADAIRNAAHAQDRDFYAFLQKLKAYQSILADTRDVLLLSSKHDLFDLMLKPPRVDK
jgi:modulator of FtsH protease HflC